MIDDAAPSFMFRILLFADDVAMWTRSRKPQFMAKKLQEEVCRIEQWTQKWGFSISGPKSKFIIFSRKRKVKDISITIDGTSIKASPDVSFLGITFDKTLTWSRHIKKKLGARWAKGLNLL